MMMGNDRNESVDSEYVMRKSSKLEKVIEQPSRDLKRSKNSNNVIDDFSE